VDEAPVLTGSPDTTQEPLTIRKSSPAGSEVQGGVFSFEGSQGPEPITCQLCACVLVDSEGNSAVGDDGRCELCNDELAQAFGFSSDLDAANWDPSTGHGTCQLRLLQPNLLDDELGAYGIRLQVQALSPSGFLSDETGVVDVVAQCPVATCPGAMVPYGACSATTPQTCISTADEGNG